MDAQRAMNAIVKPGPGEGLALSRMAPPEIGDHDVLIEVLAASICGSDMPIYRWDDPWVRRTVPFGSPIGHEFCGIIREAGPAVTGLPVGRLVTCEGHVPCNECSHCRRGLAHLCPHQRLLGFDMPGAFADFVAVPVGNVVLLPQDLPLAIAAVQDPFGNAVHAATKVAVANADILVTGCGPLGLILITLLRQLGSNRIVASDRSPYRLALARDIGADVVVNPHIDSLASIVQDVTAGDGVDLLFEMSGSEAGLRDGIHALSNGGSAVIMGLPPKPIYFDFANDLVGKGITLHGIVGREIFRTWQQAARLLPRMIGQLQRVITHAFPLADFGSAFQLMASGACGKVILFMPPALSQGSWQTHRHEGA